MTVPLLLALASGAWALVYEVVWTREVALVAGGQVEAICLVLVAYFGGLALGTRWLGPRADRLDKPQRFYALLECVAGLLAVGSSFGLDWLASGALSTLSAWTSLLIACGLLLPVTFLLGGALPALVRAVAPAPAALGRTSGLLVGANTAGAVAGVAIAMLAIPRVGLHATLLGAGAVALATGAFAFTTAKSVAVVGAVRGATAVRIPAPVLVAATLLGAATLGYEVLAARGAMLRTGSSLHAWALVLGLFLLGLALGNASFAGAARRTRDPLQWLAAIELAAALGMAVGVLVLRPALAGSAGGLGAASIATVVLAVLPPTLCMGAAFPFLVRLGASTDTSVARSFARISAFNTAGGVAGSLLATFVLLPGFGFAGAVAAVATLNALVAITAVAWATPGTAGLLRAGGFAAALLAAAFGVQTRPVASGAHVLAVEQGRQATAVVLHERTHRTLVVDGDPEAATGGAARVTEHLMAALSALLHPEPESVLEVGFGSGITLGALSRFPIAEIQCVEIAESVLAAGRFFVPDNRGVAAGSDARVEIVHDDGRRFLARQSAAYDVVLANTLHPWSVGATGLYSREYFERIARALRPGGVALQWLPLEPVGQETLGAVLRTMASVFPHGSVWWAADNLIVVAWSDDRYDDLATLAARSADPEAAAALRALRIAAAQLPERRIARFETLRAVLGEGPVLVDDLPLLERLSAGRTAANPGETVRLVAEIAAASAQHDPARAPLAWWIESKALRIRGDVARADELEGRSETAGLDLARHDRLLRTAADAERDLARGDVAAARAGFAAALAEDPDLVVAVLGIASLSYQEGRLADAALRLERVLATHADEANGWNLLGAVRVAQGQPKRAASAFEAALAADPFHIEALANAGLVWLQLGDREQAQQMLDRLRAISPLGPSTQETALAEAIDRFAG